tara:strand:- start:163 stop:582 length:420 start_codon:yes stop_codon:yes gene_type:complete
MYKKATKELSGVNVEVTKFPGRYGLGLKMRLMKIILPMIPKNEEDQGNMLDAISKALTDYTDDTIIDLVLELLNLTIVDNKPVGEEIHFDIVFSGDYGFLYEVLQFVLEVNYSSFLEMIGMKGSLSKGTRNLAPKRKVK